MLNDDDPRGVLHRHADGRVHRHFAEGFTIGGQTIADHDGTEDHSHSTMRMVVSDEPLPASSGPVVWHENTDPKGT